MISLLFVALMIVFYLAIVAGVLFVGFAVGGVVMGISVIASICWMLVLIGAVWMWLNRSGDEGDFYD